MRKRVRLLREKSLLIDGIPTEIRYKNIKNLYLRVCPPDGHIELSVPQRTSQREIEHFVSRRRTWIDERRRLLSVHAEKSEPQYVEGESIPLWGTAYPLVYRPLLCGKPYAERVENQILLHVPEDADADVRRAAIMALYSTQLAAAIEREAPACEQTVGKRASLWRIRAMKTRWGSCNVRTAAITLNLDLARYDVPALRYVITHELTHLWVRGHDARFYARMDMYFPDWREVRRRLNEWARTEEN
ncbi:M48 family metallopeptidase [Selenomonas timonae]|uniref:M48 family metallopeptidase n=1 Tax=Selenomonas timonae TaxID=2754044 RepID=A0A7G7VMJ1_9FIRM|nr:SprT family zinc-dependent metalloprotease [Selenomonas timonae]QNH55334.1 M48 family metallopeptidase [Selenomonas timonae]